MACCALANCSLAVYSSKLAYSGALLWSACFTASSAWESCVSVSVGGLPAQLLSPTTPQSSKNHITAFWLAIGRPFLARLRAYVRRNATIDGPGRLFIAK